MRLNQYIAHHSKYSRREADKLIEAGRVNVEKTKATAHTILQEGQRVFIDGKFLKSKDDFTCIVYHKPKGELVSKSDDRGRRVIYESLEARFRSFVYVGRLDYASEGLLILTDSVKVANALASSSLARTYMIKLDGSISEEMIKGMEEGFICEDARAGGHERSGIVSMEFAPFEGFEIIKNQSKYSRLKVSITRGKNRELRRFFAAFGREVLDLRRISYGFVNLNALPCGKSRFFNKDEYKALHAFLKDNNSESEGKARPPKAPQHAKAVLKAKGAQSPKPQKPLSPHNAPKPRHH